MPEKRHRFPKIPVNTLEQLAQLPSSEEQERILSRLYNSVIQLLAGNNLTVDLEKSSKRSKTREAIDRKINRRGTGKPILDIYGIRLILTEDQIHQAVEILSTRYPTPKRFPGGIPSERDYNDPTIPWNPLRQPDYRAFHKNILFTDGNQVGIAEIQLMTAGQWEIAQANRQDYDTTREDFEWTMKIFGK